ncbi:biotin--[acetyl-CoA-carboxylase] ligase [Desulfobacula phenolica]|uniref:BirA family transcriptional regulator, biotin operon repressor / biotin-[acetyl-CoA-carboxylase] ligase n=1 Tax=Desulfobacula phenolica TaxID=90732 RepID=A0A1H2JAJ5_9BACT|nr:biotin--[acetyl-CoA-carboxylase] ligase [Desulfobacula phenolica]SDU53165.1 BirA family transcriptional regulator, biotin operon repressor / biotin-[acetyl-CoA-carboxylase] ligase [Desulfobacula phenolica]
MHGMNDGISNKEMTRWQEYLGGKWDLFSNEGNLGTSESLWVSRKENMIRYLACDCTSTMDVSASLLKQNRFPQWSWILSEAQNQGRGQLGRSWISMPGNLFATIRLPQNAGTLGNLLPLALGVVLVEVMAELGLPAEIKWPNDILVGRTKVGGILVEERYGKSLAGIGINVHKGPEADFFSQSFKIIPGSFQTFGVKISVPHLWMRIELFLKHRLAAFISHPGHVVERLGKCLAFKNEPIIVTHAGPWNGPATLVDISATGGLIIRTARGDQMIDRGQISPRVF